MVRDRGTRVDGLDELVALFSAMSDTPVRGCVAEADGAVALVFVPDAPALDTVLTAVTVETATP